MRPETRVDDEADVDELLGLTSEEEEKAKADEGLTEDDVLKLIGVTEEAPADQREGAITGQEESQPGETGTQETIAPSETDETRETIPAETPAAQPDKEIRTPEWTALSFEDQYEWARRDYMSRSYRQAIEKFESMLSTNTTHSLSDNCQYWIGESYWGLGNYQEALAAFKKVFSFRNSNKDDDAQLKIGLCYMRMNDKELAKTELEKLISDYPSSEYVNTARRYLQQLQ
jgi:tol-pal system protein YbgF